jgi:hypothetical protein
MAPQPLISPRSIDPAAKRLVPGFRFPSGREFRSLLARLGGVDPQGVMKRGILMKTMMMAASALLALSAAAWADGDMTNAIGHVVRVSTPEASFDATFADGGAYSDSRGATGSWSLGDELCITVQTEAGVQENCGPWNPDLAVGDSWTTTGWSDDGSEITVEIVAAE